MAILIVVLLCLILFVFSSLLAWLWCGSMASSPDDVGALPNPSGGDALVADESPPPPPRGESPSGESPPNDQASLGVAGGPDGAPSKGLDGGPSGVEPDAELPEEEFAPPEEPPPPPQGFLIVRAYPNAKVYAGSRYLGKTPINRRRMDVGRYTLRLHHPNFPVKTEHVHIRAGRTATVGVIMASSREEETGEETSGE